MRTCNVCILVCALAIPILCTSAWSQGQITRDDILQVLKLQAELNAKEPRERGGPSPMITFSISLHCQKLIQAAKAQFSECMERETGALMVAPEPAETIANAVVGACRPLVSELRRALVPSCMLDAAADGVSDRLVLESRESVLTRIVRSRADSAK